MFILAAFAALRELPTRREGFGRKTGKVWREGNTVGLDSPGKPPLTGKLVTTHKDSPD